jgi:hypothetical protein
MFLDRSSSSGIMMLDASCLMGKVAFHGATVFAGNKQPSQAQCTAGLGLKPSS